MKSEILKNKRLKILSKAKKHIPFDGWNEKIFSTVANNLKIPIDEIHALFPNNYIDLLKLYLDKRIMDVNEELPKPYISLGV